MFSLSNSCVWESTLSCLHCLAAPTKLQALQCCLLSNNAKCATEIYWISSRCKTDGGGGGGCLELVVVSKVHRTWNQYSTWQRTLDVVLFARWLIGHRVNSLSIHHGRLRPAVPKTSSSREGSAQGDGREGRGEGIWGGGLGREAGKWAHRRDGSPVLNNYSSSAQPGGWKCCLNAAFKGLISIAVEKARLISLSSLLRPALGTLIACS